ncbi:bifunctional 2-polyprenyl-6-hydroxyphenol methylase/3-demethylubiquinol 3-O-methyltransferase UbiG [Novosphingobium sp.]|jgi:2-polyprenyl-6-hydroxyphenyl methylase/3-demethylubiquinone-9 3-methyltransferase|uniref:bifunctional 2-polyprenyl-6-hydroxyphenol methylase/3-demethylubiquinol 3-O-methyltransferase UbiG n=1 Tax=Novosphingobium sp. TaxID=1874826 RepID=UPI0022CC1FDC|nr:bifunctional 2-polyprenyl-6-hydroxyphenol methylase/3-demethylubiquinol 3-O-methyltransferase UbiG [Novosphingobium sp.]MCZ8018342.1 bifunctional 2-polyprenyl-6-hydroxyphenol methylase/3-demethylubiquinol 3-O-methyltransferase UbiG [Novosphingobium sp.]MCZ8033336.1 bifunctional 2-polyprenyl-6-hydroxyphenol methylase/3-demethylubiquinol 3-O-methyltransferase UbiG [Novosphingobium sp.]MCZ8051791.1 bifunctional 2-polyprenyl-6-hydroxyphenol methylase/3-demethylubiquinol 3-O-methyltransferase UbiG
MSNATSRATIRPEEAAHFGRLAADWWDPNGSSAMLHKLGPVRLAFLREAIDAHWGTDSRGVRPLTGKRALDVGCGAGLLAEPLARLGAAVTGVDAAQENIAVASAHAAGGGLSIDYRCGDVAELGLAGFDLVTSMEVIEHVADKPAFLAALKAALAPGGLMVLSTPNRTTKSRLLMVQGAERLGLVPRGTHHWEDFVTPEELGELLASVGLVMGEPKGIAWSPLKGLHLSDDLALNYIVTVIAA